MATVVFSFQVLRYKLRKQLRHNLIKHLVKIATYLTHKRSVLLEEALSTHDIAKV